MKKLSQTKIVYYIKVRFFRDFLCIGLGSYILVKFEFPALGKLWASLLLIAVSTLFSSNWREIQTAKKCMNLE